MGTSKGYIAPSTPYWSNAKRGVSSYIRNPSDDNKMHAAAGYAKAMNNGGTSSSSISKIFSDVISFASSSSSQGINKTLQEIGREDILSMNPQEALDKLMSFFANEGSTIDDNIALDCISAALDILQIENLEDLQKIGINRLIKELVCQFAKRKFAQLFDKQTRNKCTNIAEADARILEMQEYIYYTMESKLSDEILTTINPHNLSSEEIVQSTLNEGFELMIQYYGE